MSKLSNLKPCKACPWVRSSKVGGSDIPNFSIEQVRDLQKTCGDKDGFRNIMACHDSSADKPFGCAGYMVVEGDKNLNVRIMAIRGEIPLNDIYEKNKGVEFYASFGEMLTDYENANI